MTIYTIYANANDHGVESGNAAWLTARSGGTLADSGTNLYVGATYSGAYYRSYQVFLQFDLSAVPSDLPNSTELKIKNAGGGSGMTIKAAERTWSGGTADFVPGADLAALTQFGTHTLINSSAEYKTFTGLINPARSATYQLVLYDVDQESATAPSDNLTAQFYPAETSGTSEDPYIVMDVTRKLPGGVGSFTLAGQPASQKVTRVASPAAFTLTGIDTPLRYGKVMSASVGAFTMSGQAVTFPVLRSPPPERTFTFSISSLDETRTFTG